MSSASKDSKQRAVALKYQQNQAGSSPKVVAKGDGKVANDIIELAKQHGVLVHEDEELSQLLTHLDLGQEIPEALYHVIAELISFSYVLQGKFPSNWENVHQKIDFNE
ncbi:MAG: EscU/YscU/HrcU family type III secretion system export apparatus switch protein [Glaciecola sp.]